MMTVLCNVVISLAIISLCFDRKLSGAEATRILILGDSMGEYMGQTLESLCPGSFVQNAAIGGTTADDWAEADSDILEGCESGSWDVVYISVGGNDVLNSDCTISAAEFGEKVTSAVLNIVNNIAPNASKYLLTGYCLPRSNESSRKNFGCSEPSDYTAFQDFFLSNPPPTLPESVKVIDSTTVCGGGTDSFSNPIYFQDSIHLNSKGYCEVFTQPDIQQYLSCQGGDTFDCPSLGFEIYGLDKHCSRNPEDPPTTECTDDPTWKFNGTKKRTCAWVLKNPDKRCKKEANGVPASTACPIACDSGRCTIPQCKDNTDWKVQLKSGKMKNCKYLKKKTNKRCGFVGTDGTFGYESCRQCNICEY